MPVPVSRSLTFIVQEEKRNFGLYGVLVVTIFHIITSNFRARATRAFFAPQIGVSRLTKEKSSGAFPSRILIAVSTKAVRNGAEPA